MRQPNTVTIKFPILGLDENTAYRDQPEGTARDIQNMRAFDPQTGRARGGQRGGLAKYCTTQISGTNRIQDINQVVTIQTTSPALTALSIRSITRLAISNGRIRTFTSGGTVASPTGVSDPDFSASVPVIFSSSLYGELFFVDGVNYKKYTASTNTVAAWSASAGTIPANGADKPRLITQWRGRIVLAGIKSDPHSWFMSAVAAPTDWDYTPEVEVETQAVASTSSPIATIGEPINCLIPYTDDVLLMGLDSQIIKIVGDPMAGGTMAIETDATGMAWGRPYCIDPNGVLYFFGSRGGLYRMVPGQSPERLSAKRLEKTLSNVNFNTHIVRLAWNDREMGVHIFITPLTAAVADHYFFDARTEGFFRDRFGSEHHSPVCVHTFDGDDPEDRAILLGSNNGYVMKWTGNGLTDDGTTIDSYVTLGPIQIEQGNIEFILSQIQAIISEGSNDITYEVFVGNSAEHALSAAASRSGYVLLETGDRILLEDGTGLVLLESDSANNVDSTGTLSPIRSAAVYPRVRGYAAYVKLKNSGAGQRWALEALMAKLSAITTGKGRRS